VRAVAARDEPQARQRLAAPRTSMRAAPAVGDTMTLVGQASNGPRRARRERLGRLRQRADQAAQVGPAPVLVALAGQLGDVARAYGGGEAQAALAYLS
jgi:hypothetical protein